MGEGRPMTAGLIVRGVVCIPAFGIRRLGWAWLNANAIGQEQKTAEALTDTKKAQKAEQEKTIAEEREENCSGLRNQES